MVTFQHKLAAGLAQRGVEVTHDPTEERLDAILVIGGVRSLYTLRQARRRGVRVVQRLNGMNWIHKAARRAGQPGTGLRHFLRAEYGNWILSTIRSHLGDAIVYQSEFARQWWEREYGPTRQPNCVVYNGVDLQAFTPHGTETPPPDRCRILLMEANLLGGYERGLENALDLAREMSENPELRSRNIPVEVAVAGRVAEETRRRAQALVGRSGHVSTDWLGLLPHSEVPAAYRGAHFLYSADLNAACPNSVVEALACGLPVIAFDTGALPELVQGDAGKVVSYGGDPWKLEQPDIPRLAEAALEVFLEQERFRPAARDQAEAFMGLDRMVDGYLDALLGS